MRLRGIRGSRNVEDRRSMGGGRMSGGRVGGIGGIGLLLVLVIGYFAGIDVTPLIEGAGSPAGQTREPTEADNAQAEFSSRVLATTEDVWGKVFSEQLGRTYEPPTLVLFAGVTQSPCGGASGATGPFYCPLDEKAYLDTDFFRMLDQQMGAGGDFAAAYVIAHEVAHHVQNQLGILPKVNQARQQASETEANAMTVRLELEGAHTTEYEQIRTVYVHRVTSYTAAR